MPAPLIASVPLLGEAILPPEKFLVVGVRTYEDGNPFPWQSDSSAALRAL